MKPFILCIGLPGSGKTSTSTLLEGRLDGYRRFNYNDMRSELGIPRYSRSQDSAEEQQKVAEYLESLQLGILRGQGIIIDRAGTKRVFRSSVYEWSKWS